ncbi:TetR/AcrR family transcriptional regulator [Aeribacillus pallidus]|jgi:AcrR family transcriptional regulator|uniref:TetR family transcriptional regulator n=1 Tax=Aeribacillus pallidus TaxID=33936 RepID=A0A165X2V5_9BACI|nr:TetR/AcrR family transcriptional regulator [Aeribacillus pallidus]ASS88906.1 TetR family transcriptional regulator [Aeribacillus pallidus]KZN95566.1 TetR family transcriptional regulator [Aeribacillus pallidus]BBU41159.1 TetR family transcriptional regulator [Aeribacillus pallidus]
MSENATAETLNLTKKGMETREKLLRAAEKVFGKKGYYETSIVNITQEAGVGQGTFYNYFQSKKEVFDALIQMYSRELRFKIKEEMKDAENHEDAQRKGFQAFFRWVKDYPELYSIVQQAVVVDKDLYRWYYDKLASGFLKSLSLGVEDGEFKDINLETVAYCLMSIGQFLGMRWVFWEGQDVPEEVFDAAMTLIFNGIKKT